jgi:hypothetical protein
MRVTNIANYLTDTFNRTSSSSWGTADTGQVWQTGGGVATDYAVGSGYGSHTLTTTNVTRRSFIDSTVNDLDLYVDVTSSAAATGASLMGGPTARYLDSDNLYTARLEFTTGAVVNLTLRKRVNIVETQLATYALVDPYVAGTYYRIRFNVSGTTLRAKAWIATDAETPEWQMTVVDSDLPTTSYIGTRSIAATGNTNVNPVIRYQNLRIVNPQIFTVTRSINSVVKAQAAGTDIRLAYPTYIAL